MPKKLRNACFTLNNPTEEDFAHLHSRLDAYSYIVWGLEEGESGTPHIQGYCEFEGQRQFGAVKKLLGMRAHIEPRKGRPKQAAGYCKKGTCPHAGECEHCKDWKNDYSFFFDRDPDEPETWCEPFEYGEISEQGKRTDITEVTDMILAGSTMREVAREHPDTFVKYHRGFRDLRATLMPERCLSGAPEVIVLYGPTQTGKTRDAHIKYWPDVPHYLWRPSNTTWWDGYDGQDKVILEEFRGGRNMPFCDLLGLLDRNEFRAPIKGSFIQVQASKFVITSPCHPSGWYPNHAEDSIDQLLRRCTTIINMGQQELPA